MSAAGRAVVEKFLSVEDCQRVLDIRAAYAVANPSFKPVQLYTQCGWREVHDRARDSELQLLDDIRGRIQRETVRKLGAPGSIVSQFTNLASWYDEADHPPHADNASWSFDEESGGYRWVPNENAHRLYSAILYLNDYTDGGRLQFGTVTRPAETAPEVRGVWTETSTIVPRQGMLVLFTSGGENAHALGRCRSGPRHTLAMWFCNSPADCAEPPSFASAAPPRWRRFLRRSFGVTRT